jgi:transposase
VRLTTATIAAMGRACAVRFQGFVTAVRDLVAAAAVKHLDETGLRIGGKTQAAYARLMQCPPFA